MGLSRRTYARHRGVVESAVRKALATRRIALEADGTIDAERADAAWGATSDPVKPHNTSAPNAERAKPQPRLRSDAKPVPTAAVEAVRATLREARKDAGNGPIAGWMSNGFQW